MRICGAEIRQSTVPRRRVDEPNRPSRWRARTKRRMGHGMGPVTCTSGDELIEIFRLFCLTMYYEEPTVSTMNPIIAKYWVEKNLKSICQRGSRSLNFTPASPIDFELVAHQVALQVAKGTADIDLFERSFWPSYLGALRKVTSLGDISIVEENGVLTAVIAEA